MKRLGVWTKLCVALAAAATFAATPVFVLAGSNGQQVAPYTNHGATEDCVFGYNQNDAYKGYCFSPLEAYARTYIGGYYWKDYNGYVVENEFNDGYVSDQSIPTSASDPYWCFSEGSTSGSTCND